jgi:hypothetical protein
MQPVVKVIAESLSQRNEKHIIPTPLGGIWVGNDEWWHKLIDFTYILFTLDPWRGVLAKRGRFLAKRNTADVRGGKPIVV